MGKASKSVTVIPPPTPQEVNRKAKEKASIHDLKFYDTRHQAITNLAPKLDVCVRVSRNGWTQEP